MKKILKWTGITLAALILLVAGTAFYLSTAAQNRLAKKYDIQPQVIPIPKDSVSIAAGKVWVSTLCTGCHGESLAGTAFFSEPGLGTICAPNLTAGGPCASFSDADWLRAIKHGVGQDGRPLLIMPAKDFQFLSDEHLGQVISYLKTLPAIDQSWNKPQTTFLCKVLFQLGAFGDALNAETIDHKSPSHTAPERGITPAYGAYLVHLNGCRTCHGEQLNGGKDPNPAAPIAPNLTPGGALNSWDADGFIKTMRSGITPMGKQLSGDFMPWKIIGKYEDDQLKAIFAYLMTQPKLETARIND